MNYYLDNKPKLFQNSLNGEKIKNILPFQKRKKIFSLILEEMKTILYSGYGFSGGTIIGLIFEEIKGAKILPLEFRLLKERYGICELENSIFESRCTEIIDLAIKDFLWLCRNYSYPNRKIGKIGYGYEKRTNYIFLKATEEYINSITDFKYPMSWHFYDFRTSVLNLLIRKIFIKISGKKKYMFGRQDAYLAYPEKKLFLKNTKTYLKKIIEAFIVEPRNQGNNSKTDSIVVLPKSIPLYSKKLIMQIYNYFQDPKIIIIDRDPRDIFVELNLSKRDRYMPKTNNDLERAKGFIKYFKSIRVEQEEIKKLDKLLFLNFEELCLNYEEKITEIFEFIDFDKSLHFRKFERFNPLESKKNIGLYKDKKYRNSNAIKLIEKELQDYIRY